MEEQRPAMSSGAEAKGRRVISGYFWLFLADSLLHGPLRVTSDGLPLNLCLLGRLVLSLSHTNTPSELCRCVSALGHRGIPVLVTQRAESSAIPLRTNEQLGGTFDSKREPSGSEHGI